MAGLREAAAALLVALGLAEGPPHGFSGYVEADFVYAAPSEAGRITQIAVDEGATVAAGDVLFRLEDLAETAALRAAEARVAEAAARLDNLLTGRREAEIAVLRASRARAEAERDLAAKTLQRSTTLLERDLVPEAQVDADRAALQELEAQLAELRAELDVAELPAREAEIAAARAAQAAAEAEADRARAALDDRTVLAAADGAVERVYFETGEVVAPGAPVISILPAGRRTVLFFIAEPERATLAPGEMLQVACDGCPPGLDAEVTRIAAEPQYTAPIIYSREERARLTFRAEARLPQGASPLPGQPVTLTRQ